MRRPPRNPFYAILGCVGVLFAITASSYCIFVLRAIRPDRHALTPHVFERIMDRYGTPLLVGQLVVLAAATFGAVAIDHFEGERQRRDRMEAGPRDRDANEDSSP